MVEYLFLNGEIVPYDEGKLHVSDLGLLRGYGVFDYFRVIGGKPIFIDDHLKRFEDSAAALHLNLQFSSNFLKQKIEELIFLNPHKLLGIRLVCTGGYASDGYTPSDDTNCFMIAKPFVFQPYERGLSLMTVHHQRDLPSIKTTNYIRPIASLIQQRRLGVDDVLYHLDGKISESSRSNIFIIKNDVLITPKDGILYGVTRKKILEIAPSIMAVEVRDVPLSEVWSADEVFLSGSTKRVGPVVKIDGIAFAHGAYTRRLYEALIATE